MCSIGVTKYWEITNIHILLHFLLLFFIHLFEPHLATIPPQQLDALNRVAQGIHHTLSTANITTDSRDGVFVTRGFLFNDYLLWLRGAINPTN